MRYNAFPDPAGFLLFAVKSDGAACIANGAGESTLARKLAQVFWRVSALLSVFAWAAWVPTDLQIDDPIPARVAGRWRQINLRGWSRGRNPQGLYGHFENRTAPLRGPIGLPVTSRSENSATPTADRVLTALDR